MSLKRFHTAQADRASGYETALGEIRAGRKRSHWIWYILPQIAGLGRSSTARAFAIRDLDEACDYLRDPLLRARYEEIADAVRDKLECGIALEDLMGSSIDAQKLVSSVTLFHEAARVLVVQDASFTSLVQLCQAILEQTAAQALPPCPSTLARFSG